MLEARNLCKTYPARTQQGEARRVEAVSQVNVTFKSGEFCALVGESGSGKTTLCQLLLGLIAPTSGEVLLEGHSLAGMKRRKKKQVFSRVQMVLQDAKSALDPRLTVEDSLLEPLRNLKHLSKAEEKQRILSLLDRMELPRALLARKPHQLSGGEQKRLCIARALTVAPRLILFDEAVSGQDVLARKSILDFLREIHREQGLGFVLVTHDMAAALYTADRLLVMRDGRLVEDCECPGGRPRLTHPYARCLLETATMPLAAVG